MDAHVRGGQKCQRPVALVAVWAAGRRSGPLVLERLAVDGDVGAAEPAERGGRGREVAARGQHPLAPRGAAVVALLQAELHPAVGLLAGDDADVGVGGVGRGIGASHSGRGGPGSFGCVRAAPRTACGAGDRVTPVQVGLAGRRRASKGVAGRLRALTGNGGPGRLTWNGGPGRLTWNDGRGLLMGNGGRGLLAWHGRLVAVLVVGVLLVAQCGLDGGDGSDDGDGGPDGGDGAAAPTSEAAATSPAEAPAATAATVAPPAAVPADPATPAPPAVTETATPAAPAPPPALSGPPPVAEGTMPELRMDASGHPHALFVASFFSGPVEGFTAASSDTDVAGAGVSPPDMLIVAPVSSGSASVTVTASGPGGSATQTFTVRVGTAADGSQVAAPPAPAPAPAPPAPAPAPPAPAPAPPAPPAPFVPEDAPPDQTQQPDDSSPDDESLYSLVTEPVTAPPVVSAHIPTQTLIVGNSGTVNVSAYFSGIVQGWAVASSAPASVPVSVDNNGRASFSGNALGTYTITVTAVNDAGSVSSGFTVSVKTVSQVLLTTVGDRPQPIVTVGQTVSIDLSRYFSEAATEFDVTYNHTDPNRLINVTVQGSVASIQGLRTGTATITLVAANAITRISRPATVQVTG